VLRGSSLLAAPPDPLRAPHLSACSSSGGRHTSGPCAQKVRYAVFGCGNRQYGANYNAAARALDEGLKKLGGMRWLRRQEGDDDSGQQEKQFMRWAERVTAALQKLPREKRRAATQVRGEPARPGEVLSAPAAGAASP
jgi:sulfite reductase alpha subunit-like flavoprotein